MTAFTAYATQVTSLHLTADAGHSQVQTNHSAFADWNYYPPNQESESKTVLGLQWRLPNRLSDS